MAKQSFSNHIRFYGPHHFIFYPVLTVMFGICAFRTYESVTSDEQLLWGMISAIVLAIIYVSYMLRQHYALTLQNRIIRQEMRYRYFALTSNRFEPIEQQLRDSQIFALRFCPDHELELLVERTLGEHLSATKIKKAIKNWKADTYRV